VVNCDSYEQVRKTALTLVTDSVERISEVHTIHGACVDFGGRGMALVAPPGVGRGTVCYGLMQDERARIHSNDFFVVRYTRAEALADFCERKFYVRTRVAKTYDYVSQLFDRSRLENVVTRKEDCLNQQCENLDDCDLDRGDTHCYWASKYSRAMLDPYWIGGVTGYTKRTSLHWLVILRKDSFSPVIEEIKPESALALLEEGKFVSVGALDTVKNEPYFNPYLVSPARERLDLHRRYFKHLTGIVSTYAVNTGAAKTSRIIDKLIAIATG
jgi:hypothetical protein